MVKIQSLQSLYLQKEFLTLDFNLRGIIGTLIYDSKSIEYIDTNTTQQQKYLIYSAAEKNLNHLFNSLRKDCSMMNLLNPVNENKPNAINIHSHITNVAQSVYKNIQSNQSLHNISSLLTTVLIQKIFSFSQKIKESNETSLTTELKDKIIIFLTQVLTNYNPLTHTYEDLQESLSSIPANCNTSIIVNIVNQYNILIKSGPISNHRYQAQIKFLIQADEKFLSKHDVSDTPVIDQNNTTTLQTTGPNSHQVDQIESKKSDPAQVEQIEYAQVGQIESKKSDLVQVQTGPTLHQVGQTGPTLHQVGRTVSNSYQDDEGYTGSLGGFKWPW